MVMSTCIQLSIAIGFASASRMVRQQLEHVQDLIEGKLPQDKRLRASNKASLRFCA